MTLQQELERLKGIASKATPGFWYLKYQLVKEKPRHTITGGIENKSLACSYGEINNAEHIAAFSPSVALAMIECVQALYGVVSFYETTVEAKDAILNFQKALGAE